jgi:cadmium resistance protein CadD (predicted permease)
MQKSLFLSAALAFFSTTMDDFAVMLVFFARAQQMEDTHIGYMKVILGQTIGFSIVVLISMLGLVLGIFIPMEYVDLVGFIPIIAGIQNAYEVLVDDGFCECCHTGTDGEDRKKRAEYQKVNAYDDTYETGSTYGSKDAGTAEKPDSSGASYQKVADVEEVAAAEEVASASGSALEMSAVGSEEEDESNCLSRCVYSSCVRFIDTFTLEVVVYALICSSDNIGIYLTLFASMTRFQVMLTVATFYVLLLLNILIAIMLMRCRAIADCFQKYSKYFVPPLLIFLGLYILSSSVLRKYI